MTLNTIQGKVFGQARSVRTKYGERSVVDVTLADGTTKAIWKAAGDPSIHRLADGERVTLKVDEKGNVQEIEGSYDRAQCQRAASRPISPPVDLPTETRPMGFQIEAPFEAERRLRAQIAAAKSQPSDNAVQLAETGSSIDGRIAELAAIYGQCLAATGSELAAIEIFRMVATNA
jgi:hypothetical protein